MTTIRLPIKSLTIGLGKRKERSQMCEVLTPDGRWEDYEIDVNYGVMVDDKQQAVFLLDSDHQFLAEDGTWHQVLFSKSGRPLQLYKTEAEQVLSDSVIDDDELANELFKLTRQRAQADGFSAFNEADKREWIMKLVTIIVSAVVLIFGISFFFGK